VRTSAVRIAGACAITAALALSVAACGSQDKKAACDKLQKTITEVSQKGMTQVSDPNGLAQTYSAGANTMRQEGKDSGDDKVEKAANDAASALESLGQQVKSIATSGSTSPQMPDVTKLTNAGAELKSACED
jgi:Flp pilus assembly protein TadD